MSIHKIGSDLIRPQATKPATEDRRAPGASKGADEALADRTDRVEFSEEGRELAAKLVEADAGLSEARRTMIQDRIAQGFYNDLAVAEDVAQRLVESGDLLDTP